MILYLLLNGWKKEKNVHNIFLCPLYDELMVIALSFHDMCFKHMYRERNGVADALSKESLQITPSNWKTWHHVVEIMIDFDMCPMAL